MKWIASAIVVAGTLSFGAAEADAARQDIRIGNRCNDVRVQSCGPRAPLGGRLQSRDCRPRYQRIWVPPVTRSVHVGYDRCGNHIHRQVVVRAGYWRTVRVR